MASRETGYILPGVSGEPKIPGRNTNVKGVRNQTHVFFVEAILRRTLVEMEALGIRRVLTHSEKAAAYMADGYARVSREAGSAWPSPWGRLILRRGFSDPYLGLSPVWIALTGKKTSVCTIIAMPTQEHLSRALDPRDQGRYQCECG